VVNSFEPCPFFPYFVVISPFKDDIFARELSSYDKIDILSLHFQGEWYKGTVLLLHPIDHIIIKLNANDVYAKKARPVQSELSTDYTDYQKDEDEKS